MSEDQYAERLPSDPVVLEKLRGCAQEIADALTAIADKRSYIKDAVKAFHEEHKVDKKLIRELGKIRFKDNLKEIVDDTQDKVDAYELVFKTSAT